MSDELLCFDASTAIPLVAVEGTRACLGYLGLKPHPDPMATHAWTLAEWLRFQHLRQIPAWVANVGAMDLASEGAAQAEAAVEAAAELGWHRGRVIFNDLEAWRDPVYWKAWRARVEKMDYQAGRYSSEVVADDYPSDWKWLALPDGKPEIPDGYDAKQYAWDVPVAANGRILPASYANPPAVVDLSVVSRKLFDHGGVGPRHG